MKNQNNDYIEDIIERYIYQVTKHMTVNRKDIEQELRTLIYDMLDDRVQDHQPGKEDIDAVLTELGNPSEMADKYRGHHQYLIGPELFPRYLFILKIVLAATLLGMSIATILGVITESSPEWYYFIGKMIGGIISGLIMAFAYVTIIFAVFEWRGITLKELSEGWEVSSLPALPVKEASIHIAEPIVSISFTILVMILFITAPQLLGIYFIDHNISTSIPIFDLEKLHVVLPLFLIIMGLGLLKDIWELVERKYTIKYSIFKTVINAASILLVIIIFGRFKVWNPNFMAEVNTVFGTGDLPIASAAWNFMTSRFALFLTLIYLLDTGVTLYKSFKYDSYRK